MINYRSACLYLLGLTLAASAHAQDSDATEPLPQYDVELVIFKNLQVPKGREFVLPVSSPGRDERMLDLASPESVKAAANLGYRLLPGNELRLLDQVARIVESPRYELLLHVGWRQPGVEREAALPIWIRAGKVYGPEYTSIDSRIPLLESRAAATAAAAAAGTGQRPTEEALEALELQALERLPAERRGGIYELEGKISIALSRYLHASTDFVLRRPQTGPNAMLPSATENDPQADISTDSRILDNHRLRESRRMRSRNLHYLDNPEFGLLILITPYEAPDEATAIPAAESAGSEPGG